MLNNVFLLPRKLTELQFHPVSCGVCDAGADFTRETARAREENKPQTRKRKKCSVLFLVWSASGVGTTLQIRSDACLHGNVHVNTRVVSMKPPSVELWPHLATPSLLVTCCQQQQSGHIVTKITLVCLTAHISNIKLHWAGVCGTTQ